YLGKTSDSQAATPAPIAQRLPLRPRAGGAGALRGVGGESDPSRRSGPEDVNVVIAAALAGPNLDAHARAHHAPPGGERWAHDGPHGALAGRRLRADSQTARRTRGGHPHRLGQRASSLVKAQIERTEARLCESLGVAQTQR